MGVIEITSLLQFEKENSSDKTIIVDFYATWCGPCKMIYPKFNTLSDSHTDITFLKVDIDQVQKISEKYRIEAMPTFIVFKNGAESARLSGASQSKLVELVDNA